MKKLLLTTVALVAIIAGANAQNFKKGDWTLGANLSELNLSHTFSYKSSYSTTSFRLATNVGYFVFDKFAVEASAGISYSRLRSEIKTNSSSFTWGAGVRYYPIGNLFARVYQDRWKSINDEWLSSLTVSVGYDLFISERLFFEPMLYWSKYLVHTTGMDIGIALGIGFKF
jgi:opacity protein-like surface antigen